MAFSYCFCHHQFSPKIDPSRFAAKSSRDAPVYQRSTSSVKGAIKELFGNQFVRLGGKPSSGWSFLGGSRAIVGPYLRSTNVHRESSRVYASWLSSPQLANTIITWGTVAVLPFYTLMVVAPKAELTRKSMESSIPFVMLAVLYGYVLYLSWTPDTLRLMFSGKYWLPELPGIAKMFSSEMTLASAWIHFLVVDLFAARLVYHDGLENKIETRHSISICMLFCPIGIFAHAVTKALTQSTRKSKSKFG